MNTVKEFTEKLREKAAIFSKSDFAVVGIAKDYKDAADMIEKLAEEYKQGWIFCSERLPKEEEDVILTFRNSTGIYVEMATYIWRKFYYISYADENYYEEEVKEPIAWMPLPDPYKPEQQKEIPTKHYEERFNRIV